MDTNSAYAVPNLRGKIKRAPGAEPLAVTVPGSKSITNRALLLATLADGASLLKGVLFSDDSKYFLRCLHYPYPIVPCG